MTDTSGSTPPFPGFPGLAPAEMLEHMWGMMRLAPFGSAFPGAQSGVGAGLAPSLSMMSDMMAPLTNVEELDKRITDMRAVEQWLKLNLSMLQSAIQALEVQRATLATLRAFGAFAQSSMSQPAPPTPAPATGWPHPDAKARPAAAAPDETDEEAGAASATPPFDASAWWNLLQSQFNQIAQFAMTEPGAADVTAATASGTTGSEQPFAAAAGSATSDTAKAGAAGPAAKRPAPKRASAPTRRASAPASGARAAKKSADKD